MSNALDRIVNVRIDINRAPATVDAYEHLLIIGLSNDELGYIVPPSDFLLNKEAPYLAKTMDYKGENHYEETNSVGPLCAERIAEAFDGLMQELLK